MCNAIRATGNLYTNTHCIGARSRLPVASIIIDISLCLTIIVHSSEWIHLLDFVSAFYSIYVIELFPQLYTCLWKNEWL